ncbi:hypothetical protein FB45DRAFT_1057259 [Roridomyces roridus]|uniref:Uncharacterized protein n=1 Tax=Roridomyces roridus TaxID=1738132 RepID=A0AAD7BVV8_9AGAR|nr:hypothetical protein FB45DRAFT_1057259 [Roridomyces roridus]
MDATVGDPFLLASYSVAQRIQKKAAKQSPSVASNLYATHEKIASGSSDGYATVTAQGDGVHILDLSTLHPVISHTLGPSTTFSCPSVTVGLEEDLCATYAAIASSPDVAPENSGRTIHVWRESLATVGDRASQKKKASVMPHYISEIYAPRGLPQRLLLLSPTGDVTVVDEDLAIRSTLPPPPTTVATLQTFAFPRDTTSFLPGPPGTTAIVLLETLQDASTSIRVLSISGDEGKDLGSCKLPLETEGITTAACSSSGFLSVLVRDGSWYSYHIDSKNDTISVYPAAQPLRLKSLSFVGSDVPSGGETCTLALNTSHVLLAAISSPTRNIVLLLWDLQYSVLLASHILPIPSALSHLPKLSISLRPAVSTSLQALLILTPPVVSQDKSATRSSVFVVPLTVPPTATIANAMGRAAAGAQWLVQPSTDDTLDPARAAVLAAVQTAMSNKKTKTAEQAFFDWDQKNEKPGVLGHSFVRDLLSALLPPSSSAYSSVLVRHLIERRVVSTGMVAGGLLAALKQRDDWIAINLCTTHVFDLAESDLMFILQFVVDHNRKMNTSDAMEVDSLALGAVPTLPVFLTACVGYNYSPNGLRAAIRQHLRQPEDVLEVLQVLDDWVEAWRSTEMIVFPGKKSTKQDEHGVTVLLDGWNQEKSLAHPPLDKVLSFIQNLLDASFLALLQHAPAHPVIRRVLARIEPEVQLTEQMESLRGPLELFARAQARAVRDGKEGKKDTKRKQLAHQRMAMAAGSVYQLEEIVL